MKSRHKTTRTKDTSLSLRGKKGKMLFLLIFTLVHALLTALIFIWSFSKVLAHADDNDPLPIASRLLVSVSDVFQWPLFLSVARSEYLQGVLPNFSIYIIGFLNSLLWALAALAIMLFLRGLRRSKKRYRIR